MFVAGSSRRYGVGEAANAAAGAVRLHSAPGTGTVCASTLCYSVHVFAVCCPDCLLSTLDKFVSCLFNFVVLSSSFCLCRFMSISGILAACVYIRLSKPWTAAPSERCSRCAHQSNLPGTVPRPRLPPKMAAQTAAVRLLLHHSSSECEASLSRWVEPPLPPQDDAHINWNIAFFGCCCRGQLFHAVAVCLLLLFCSCTVCRRPVVGRSAALGVGHLPRPRFRLCRRRRCRCTRRRL